MPKANGKRGRRLWWVGGMALLAVAAGLALRPKGTPEEDKNKTKTSKADLVAALKEAIAYCDRAYDGMTDASAVETIKFMGGDAPRLAALNVNSLHTVEHYGNLVVYLRMKNIVPPSSEPGFMEEMRKK